MRQLLGGILMAIGILIAGASGLCSLYFLFGSGSLGMFPIVLVVGGVPFGVGAALIVGGRALIRSVRKPPNPDDVADIFR